MCETEKSVVPFLSVDIYDIITLVCLVTQLCLTICYPLDCNSTGSSSHGISQARILEWVAISFSRECSQPMDQTHVSCLGRQSLYYWATIEVHFTDIQTQIVRDFTVLPIVTSTFFFFYFAVDITENNDTTVRSHYY